MRVLNAAQMREADRRTIEEIGIPSVVLMENAGRQVAAAIVDRFGALDDARVSILAGRGNNGGDGFVVARTLAQRGVDVGVFLLAAAADVRGDALTNLSALHYLGISVAEVRTADDWALRRGEVLSCDLIVDAIFGTGLSAGLTGVHELVVEDVNDTDVPVVAIDLPSGLSADTPVPPGSRIDATLTVTLAAPKYPLVLPPGQAAAGELVIAEIGIPREVIASIGPPWVELLDSDDVRDLVPERGPETHKGDVGHVLVVSGSRGKTGAAHLAAVGALRSGAGLVTVATPASCQAIVAGLGAEYMTVALDDEGHGACATTALPAVLRAPGDVVAIGPGLGTGAGAAALVRGLLEQSDRPLVLDADAINVLAGVTGRLSSRPRTVVMTPHPGELARFAGVTTAEVQADRIGVASRVAADSGAIIVLKGHRTLVVTPEGRVGINMTGNPGMATGGSGDVLTGMIAAWMAQIPAAEDACRLAVYLHGAAGDLAADRIGESALTAGDITASIGHALLRLIPRDQGGTPA